MDFGAGLPASGEIAAGSLMSWIVVGSIMLSSRGNCHADRAEGARGPQVREGEAPLRGVPVKSTPPRHPRGANGLSVAGRLAPACAKRGRRPGSLGVLPTGWQLRAGRHPLDGARIDLR